MSSERSDHGIDIARAAKRIIREEKLIREQRHARYLKARSEFEAAVEAAKAFPTVQRIITWGSILRPERFTERSDIDICVQGIDDPREWSRLERALLDLVTLPLDLVRWEELMEPHRESILARGEVVYESNG
jgi:predicted nucleotidyltransferase